MADTTRDSVNSAESDAVSVSTSSPSFSDIGELFHEIKGPVGQVRHSDQSKLA